MPEEQTPGGLLSFILLLFFTTFVLWFFEASNPLMIIGIAILLLILVRLFLPPMVIEFAEYERGVVLRFGAFNRIVGPGWVFVFPLVEKYIPVDMRVQTSDITPQTVVTNDNIRLNIDAIIYLRVVDAAKAVLTIKNYRSSSISYIQAHLRDVIGKLPLSDVISKVEEINFLLRKGLQEISKDWGIETVKVEVQSIELPEEIIAAMHERKSAEQFKLAAEEKAKARELMINAVQNAAGKLTSPALSYLYMDALKKIAEGKSTKLVFPMEISRLAEGLFEKLTKERGQPVAVTQAIAPPKEPVDYSAVITDLMSEYQKIYQKYVNKMKEKEIRKK